MYLPATYECLGASSSTYRSIEIAKTRILAFLGGDF
jgi:hypothetical protein